MRLCWIFNYPMDIYIYISIDKYIQISIIYIVYIVIMSMDIYKSIMDTVVIG